jgi:adenine-specific DNA-methyltransferase
MDGESIDIKHAKLQKLKELFPELFAENQLDWEKLKAAFGDDINFANERYVLNWAGKSDAFRVLQQPTTATLKPAPEESVNFDTTENLFIEGENLEVLKALQKAYYGKVKCIEIDPPYNTGSDSFIYPDRFSEKKEDYLKRIGDKDEEGYLLKEGLFRKNSKDSGHFHSNWLSMMYPRLFLAKNLLRDDGVIFVHIDDNEVHNLRMMMNEIFGEENFVCQFIWKSRQNKDNRNITGASIDHEYILCYGRKIKGSQRKTEQYSNPDNDHRGPWISGNMVGLATQENRPNLHYDLVNPETGVNYGKPKLGWRYDRETMDRLIQEKRIIWPESSSGRPRKKTFLSELYGEFTGFSSIIGKNIYTRTGTAEIESLFGFRIFDFPKPSSLLKELVSQGSDDGDIVLDFFAGSSPLAHAVLELDKEDGGNRKFILVQMPEQCDENSEAYKAGYKTIADIAKERIRRVIQKIEKEKTEKPNLFEVGKLDLGFKVFKLSPSNFKIWRGSEIDSDEKLVQQMDAFTNPIRPGAEKQNMLYELMLKAGYELASPVQYVIASGAKQSQGKKIASGSTNPRNDSIGYYSINNNELIIALDAMSEKLIEQIIAAKPQKVITLDSLFTGNDQLKTNTVLQMRDAGIDFKTI